MSKRYDRYILDLYDAILRDIKVKYPSNRRGFERDSSRLHFLVAKRGSTVLTIDLPTFGKHFDRCLSNARLTRSMIPCFKVYRRGSPIPRLFKEMVLRVFHEDGTLRADADIDMIRYLRQLFYGAKKVKVTCDVSKTYSTVNEFYSIDRGCWPASTDWDNCPRTNGDSRHGNCGVEVDLRQYSLRGFQDSLALYWQEDSSSLETFNLIHKIQQVADVIMAELGVFDPLVSRPQHGPGAVSDLRYREVSKYTFPTWSERLESVFPKADLAFANYGCWADWLTQDDNDAILREEEGCSKLISVPKTQKAPRLIASEPVSNQWCQQAIEDFLQSGVKRTSLKRSIDFFSQEANRRMALQASQSQEYATIDLSSASDRMSCWLVERVFRRNPTTLDAIKASRTRFISNDIDRKSPKLHKLRKLSAMGSAITFPVQTYVYAIIAMGALLHVEGHPVTIKNIRKFAPKVRVFGDDMIVPITSTDATILALETLKFKVNTDKTFFTGKFRESCGIDAYDGNDVSAVYAIALPSRSRPESLLSILTTRNNFYTRGYFEVADYLENLVRKEWPFLAVPYEPIGSGVTPSIWTHMGKDWSHLKRRWNSDLQLYEYYRTLPKGKSTIGPQDGNSNLLQYFTEEPAPHQMWKAGARLRPVTRVSNRWAL